MVSLILAMLHPGLPDRRQVRLHDPLLTPKAGLSVRPSRVITIYVARPYGPDLSVRQPPVLAMPARLPTGIFQLRLQQSHTTTLPRAEILAILGDYCSGDLYRNGSMGTGSRLTGH